MTPFTFNDLLCKAGIDPRDVRLLRHQEHGPRGQTPFSLWVEDPDKLRRYQEVQRADRRSRFNAPLWASFVATPEGKTLFVGIFEVRHLGLAGPDYLHPFDESPLPSAEIGKVDLYACSLIEHAADLAGRLVIDWGPGMRSWVQRADSSAGASKPILEIREEFVDPQFPGFQELVVHLSDLPSLPLTWRIALQAVGGVYLLTCPQTCEQYVGQAYGADGFWGRWMEYLATGHGGNIGLKSRDPSDYQVTVLEVCGTQVTPSELLEREALWKRKLQSREMGLNRN